MSHAPRGVPGRDVLVLLEDELERAGLDLRPHLSRNSLPHLSILGDDPLSELDGSELSDLLEEKSLFNPRPVFERPVRAESAWPKSYTKAREKLTAVLGEVAVIS